MRLALTIIGHLTRRVAGLTAVSLLAGCSAISAVKDATATLEVYTLRAPQADTVARSPAPIDLIVEIPTTSGALDTDRIMIRPSALQAQYLPDVRWGETVPVMVQSLLLRSLEDSQGFRYVGRRPIGPGGDFALLSELTDFQAEISGGEGAVVTLRMTVRLVREEDAAIVAGRTFTATAATTSTEAPALVAGFDRATQEIMGEIVEWTFDALDIGL